MNRIKIISFFSICFLLSQAVLGQSITLNYSNKKQVINLMGADMERSSSFLQSASNAQEIADWCFKDIEFGTCRVAYDKKQELEEGVKNFSFYTNTIASMKMIQKANPAVKFYATMKSDYNGYNKQNNLPDWICDYAPTTWFNVEKYALFLADYLQLMHNNGVGISYIAMAKEWSVLTVERCKQVIDLLNAECDTRSVPRPFYVDPASWGLSQGVSFVNSVGSKGYTDRYYAFSSHNLNNQTHLWDDFVDACHALNRSAWNDESGSGPGGRTYGAEPETLESLLGAYSEKADMYSAGLEGELIFEVFSRGVSSETRTIYFTNGSKGKRMRSYYIMKQFGNNTYQRSYVPPTVSGMSGIKTMAFASEKEIALWVINNNEDNYTSIPLNISNTYIGGVVYQYIYNTSTSIKGEASTLTAIAPNQYTFDLPGKSISFFKIHLTEERTPDNLSVSTEAVDFGATALTDAGLNPSQVTFNVEAPTTAVTLTLSGANASAFSLDGLSTIEAQPLIWEHPIDVFFNPDHSGMYNAVLTISSGSNSKTILLTGEAYASEIVNLPFLEEFPNLVPSSVSLTNEDINNYSTYKGWQVKNGFSSGAERMTVINDGITDIGYFLSPKIVFEGPCEIRFFARMKLNDMGSTGTEKSANNKLRNMYAVIGSDTIYDHHKAGMIYFQNYNEWKCTYSFEGTERIKFFAITKDEGVWADVVDGMTFGAKTSGIKVQSTTLPTLNIAYGHTFYLGSFERNKSHHTTFDLKGWNLSSGVVFTQDVLNKARLQTLTYSPTSGTIQEGVPVIINTLDLEPGSYTEKILLNSTGTDFKERTIWLTFDVDEVDGIQTRSYMHKVYGRNGQLVIESSHMSNASIYTLKGSLIKRLNNISTATVSLPKGFYLVEVGNEMHKIIL